MVKMRASGSITSIQESKVPNLNVPEFVGNPLKGDLFEQKLVTIFGNNAMALFLTSEYRCDNHPAWSGAFASRLRDSLRNYTIVEYLSTELEEEQHYSKVWKWIGQKLSTTEVNITWMSQDCHAFFGSSVRILILSWPFIQVSRGYCTN